MKACRAPVWSPLAANKLRQGHGYILHAHYVSLRRTNGHDRPLIVQNDVYDTRERAPQLRDRLAEQGFRVARFDVDVSERHAGDTSREPHGSDSALPAAAARRRLASADMPEELAPPAQRFVYGQPGKLNVVI